MRYAASASNSSDPRPSDRPVPRVRFHVREPPFEERDRSLRDRDEPALGRLSQARGDRDGRGDVGPRSREVARLPARDPTCAMGYNHLLRVV